VNREDVLGSVGRAFDFLPQLGDEIVDGARGGKLFVAPYLVENLFAGDHLAGMLDEVAEQIEFARGELDARLAAPRLVQLEIDLDVADANHVRGRLLLAGPAQHGANPRQ
jgi:hypothetical protein